MLLLLLLSSLVPTCFCSRYLCPAFCHQQACDNGVLTCSLPGLNSVPSSLPPRTTKVLIMHQDLSQAGDLSYQNLSNYGPPNFRVQKITIQHSRLTGIAPESFSHLSELSTLDFSYNRIAEIKALTFESLNLAFLRLDGNAGLGLQCASFHKAIIRHLSLVNCSLAALPYCVLRPVAGLLRRLDLSHNRLRTVSPQFDLLFQRLQELRLPANPLDCSRCRLHWLARSLQMRLRLHSSSNSSLASVYPHCQQPPHLAGRFLHQIDVSINSSCHNPAIRLIDIRFHSLSQVRLRCEATSPLDAVAWQLDNNRGRQTDGSDIVLGRSQARGRLLCVVTNQHGRASAQIRVSWPLSAPSREAPSTTEDSRDRAPQQQQQLQQFSLMELLAAVLGSFAVFLVLFTLGLKLLLLRSDHQHKLPSSATTAAVTAAELKYKLTSPTTTAPSDPSSHALAYNDWELLRYDQHHQLEGSSSSQLYDTPTFPTSIFLDYKTHQRIRAAAS